MLRAETLETTTETEATMAGAVLQFMQTTQDTARLLQASLPEEVTDLMKVPYLGFFQTELELGRRLVLTCLQENHLGRVVWQDDEGHSQLGYLGNLSMQFGNQTPFKWKLTVGSNPSGGNIRHLPLDNIMEFQPVTIGV